MHPLIRFAAALVFLFLAALSVLAGPRSVHSLQTRFRPLGQMQIINDLLPDSGKSVHQNESPDLVSDLPSTKNQRICACQVLHLQSSNYDHRYVVLLAEKADFASSAGFKAARNRIEKEKKQLKKLFYDKVKIVAELQGNGSCKSLYSRLRLADEQLQLYEILSAD
jgi:hypothetical protein